MTQLWDTMAAPKAQIDNDIDVILGDLIEGVDTGVTWYYGSADPSSGASWGAAQMGVHWFDAGNELGEGGDDLGGGLKVWVKLTGTPTYGWRSLYGRAYIAIEPNINALDLTSQSTVTDTDLDLVASTSTRAIAVRLLVTVIDSGTPASTVFASLRKNGTTTDARERRCYPQAAGVPCSQIIECELDAAQVLEYAIHASGTGTFDFRVDVLGYYERLA